MSKVTTILVAVLLFFGSPASPQVVTSQTIQTTQTPGAPTLPPRDPQQPQTGTARISGRVFAADTASPLRKAQVRIFAAALREQRMTSTDANGKYEFKDLPGGRYTVTASKGSYVTLSYGQQRPFEPGKPIEILDTRSIEKVDFTLPRGGVVIGRIIDEFGDPVADAQVMAMRYSFQQGRRQLSPAGRSSQTNDIGEFRLFGLPPGQYYLSATLRNFGPMGTSDDRSGYAPTYYPGTASVGEAQKVTVGVGQTVSNINMALLVTRTAHITGTVVDSDGKPGGTGMVMVLQRSGAMTMMSAGAQIRGDGSFTLSNVAPGEYTLMANLGGGLLDPLQTATANLTVSGEDIEGLRLAAVRPAVLSGRIVLDGAMPNANIRGAQFRLNAVPLDPEQTFGIGGGGAANDDLTFQIRVRPCVCVVRSPGSPSGWYMKAVRLNGADITDTGVEFRPEQEVGGIEIVLTNQPADLSGLVTDAKGQPSRDYTVVVFPRDRQRWTPGTRYISTGRPDQDGRYKLRGLPAGDYYAIALEYVEQGEWTDPEFLERSMQTATPVSLGEGETKTLDLKLVSAT